MANEQPFRLKKRTLVLKNVHGQWPIDHSNTKGYKPWFIVLSAVQVCDATMLGAAVLLDTKNKKPPHRAEA